MINRFSFKLVIAVIGLIVIQACSSSLQVWTEEEWREKPQEKKYNGFFYTMPAHLFQFRLSFELEKIERGSFSQFDHLVNFSKSKPVDGPEFEMKILGAEAVKKIMPDTSERYFIYTGDLRRKPFAKSGKTFLANSKYPSDTSLSLMFAQSSRNILVYRQIGQKSRNVKTSKESLRESSLKSQLEGIMDENQKLIEELYRSIANAKDTSEERKNELLKLKIDSIYRKMKEFEYGVENVTELFKTYKGEDIALKAKKYADIIHKLIQLKTEVAGAQSDMEYRDADVKSMTHALDEMIDHYLLPFQNEMVKEQFELEFSYFPGKHFTTQQFYLYKNGYSSYYIDTFERADQKLASFVIQTDNEAYSTAYQIESNSGGWPYKVNSSFKLSLYLKKNDELILLGECHSKIPQMSKTAFFPVLQKNVDFEVDQFNGEIRSIELH